MILTTYPMTGSSPDYSTMPAVIYSSEKNSYIRDDLAQVWKGFSQEVNQVQLDNKGRGIADVNTLFSGRVRDTSTLKTVVLLERDSRKSSFPQTGFRKRP